MYVVIYHISQGNRAFDAMAYAAATSDTIEAPGYGYVIYTTFTGDYHLYLSNW